VKRLAAFAIASFVTMLAIVTAQEGKLEFEVATVRPSSREVQDGVVLGLRMDGAQARIGALTLRDYVAMAYRVKAYQVVGPDWISSERFDVNAKLPAGSTADQIPRMLQALLEERFALTFHREPTDMPVYALNVGKPPLRLKESPVDPDAVTPKGAVSISASGSAAGVAVDLGNGSFYTFASGKFEAKKISGRMLADVLERYTDRPILDRTGLPGNYDFSFDLTPEDYQTMLIRAAVNSGVFLPPQVLRMMDNGGNPLPEALSQLGLRLDPARAPVDLLIVDRARRTPTDN
jgi:uncharacterized protein (TIGR03435 family)